MSTSTVTTTPGQAFWSLVRTEFRLSVREPAGLVVGLGAPVLLIVIFGNIPTFHTPQDALGGLSPLDLYGPILIVFTLSMLALSALPLRLATYRELGFLRRLAVTPVQPFRLLLAQLTVYATVAVAGIALILGIGATAYHLRLPGSIPGLTITLVLTAAALFPIGLLIASSAPTAKAAGAIGSILFFALVFASGMRWPLPTMPDLLRAVVEKTPTGAAVEALNDTNRRQLPRPGPPGRPRHLRRGLHHPRCSNLPLGVRRGRLACHQPEDLVLRATDGGRRRRCRT